MKRHHVIQMIGVALGCCLTTCLSLKAVEGLTCSASIHHLVLLYTGETQNFLEVCGCRQSGLGGLARRAALVQQVRQETPHVLLLDSGNLADDPHRGAVITQAMSAMGYQGVTVGAMDFKLGKEFFDNAQAAGLPLVVSAWRPPTLPAWVKESLLLEVGGRKVGVVGLTLGGKERVNGSLGQGGNEEAGIQHLAPLLTRLRGEADLVVALSQWGIGRDRALARWAQQTPPLIDLIVGNASAEGLLQPEVIGGTWIVPISTKGQHVGRVDVNFESPLRLRWRLIPVDKSFPDEPQVAALVGKYYAEQAEALLQASQEEEQSSVDVKAAYATAEQCAECHAQAFEMWQKQKHAHAIQTLVAKRRLVGECLRCHSEHYRRTGKLPKGLGLRGEGPSGNSHPSTLNPQPSTLTDGVSCSTCHGEGVIHSLTGTKRNITRSPGQALCRRCHDRENDDDFDYKRDLKKIRHW